MSSYQGRPVSGRRIGRTACVLVCKRSYPLPPSMIELYLANFYHIMPRPNGKRWEAFQYHDPKTGKGAVYVFRAGAEEDSQTVKLKGLDPAARYSVQSIDGSVAKALLTGRELMESGFTSRLGVKESSDLVFIERVK